MGQKTPTIKLIASRYMRSSVHFLITAWRNKMGEKEAIDEYFERILNFDRKLEKKVKEGEKK